jgi:glutamate-5-semialdehyde dehydrogenase
MNVQAKDATGLESAMLAMGRAAREAAAQLREATTGQKNMALLRAANAIRMHQAEIVAANAKDMAGAEARGLSPALLDRLKLDAKRIEAIAKSVAEVAQLPDPVGRELARWKRPNGLDIARVSTPIGVIGIIYESRPNVTADAGALCLKSGNVAILRGGSESANSSRAIHAALVEGLRDADLREDAIQLVPTTDRAAVGHMLGGLNGALDMIVPRGGKSLVARVQAEARVPVLAHLEGICHTYVHEKADLAMARAIVVNAKMRRTGVCGATETLLIDKSILESHAKPILDDLAAACCEIRGDAAIRDICPDAKPANEEDWRTEYLDAIIAVRAVSGVEEAVAHIAAYGSQHTESIVTDDARVAERFMSALDSAIVMHNASTQFADGGEFGMGAEIGIGTGKLHARGPVGVEQLTIFKYVVRGSGQTRP